MLATKDYRHFQVLSPTGHILSEFEGAAAADHSLPGDSVEICDGGVVKRLMRSEKKTLVGILHLTSKYMYGLTNRGIPLYLCDPLNRGFPSFRVACKERDRSKNLLITFQFDSWDDDAELPRGGLVRILGPCENFQAESEALAILGGPWSAPRPAPKPLGSTRDRIHLSTGTFNIDPVGCKDIDDVITLVPIEDGKGWQLWVTIADVSEFVCPGTSEYDSAFKAASTVYQDGHAVRPMLHRDLSEGSCSLVPGQLRFGVALSATFQNGVLSEPTFQKVIVMNQESYTYEGAYQSWAAAPLAAIASCLAGREVTDSHEWIEQLMLWYNKEAAKVLSTAGQGLLRRHDAPVTERATSLKAIDPALEFLAYRAAEYCAVGSADIVHAGLGLGLYCHASSPIRRFADLVNQRILKWFIDGLKYTADDLEAVACRLNWRQKEIAGAERDYQFLKAIHAATKHEVCVKILDTRSAWVAEWNTIIWFSDSGSAGSVIRLRYFCDRRKVAWKERMVFEKISA